MLLVIKPGIQAVRNYCSRQYEYICLYSAYNHHYISIRCLYIHATVRYNIINPTSRAPFDLVSACRVYNICGCNPKMIQQPRAAVLYMYRGNVKYILHYNVYRYLRRIYNIHKLYCARAEMKKKRKDNNI